MKKFNMKIEPWFILSAFVGFIIGLAVIMNTFLVNGHIKPEILIIYKFSIAFIASIVFLGYLINKKEIKFEELYKIDAKYIGLMIFGGMLTFFLVFGSIMALENIPNGGYSVATKSSFALLVSFLLSITLLDNNNHINIQTTIGIIFVVIGVSLIKIYSKK